MAGKKTVTIMITVLLTTLVVGGLVYILRAQRINRLEAQVDQLESTNAELQEQVAALQAQLETLPGDENGIDGENGDCPQEVAQAPNPGWEQYFPTATTTTLMNEPVQQVCSLLGKPPVLIRSIAVNPAANREIWVYRPFEEDLTGLYIFFKGNQVTGSLLDEFHGLFNSGLLDDENFWLN